MNIERNIYLDRLVHRMHNGMIKVITGIRRCGKSYLLFKLFYRYLLEQGVPEENIIVMELDRWKNREYRNPEVLLDYIDSHMPDDKQYYILLDEVQMMENFEEVLNSLLHYPNADIYVTGSNSKFLSSEINTIFRGRSDEVSVLPFTFREFCQDRQESVNDLWKEYYTYGGLPALRKMPTAEQKTTYLQKLWKKTYLDDVVERHNVENREALEAIADALCSSIGSLTNTTRITNTLGSVRKIKITFIVFLTVQQGLLYVDVIYAVIMSYHREFLTSIIAGIKIELYFIKNRTCNLHTCISRTGRMNTGSSQHIPR